MAGKKKRVKGSRTVGPRRTPSKARGAARKGSNPRTGKRGAVASRGTSKRAPRVFEYEYKPKRGGAASKGARSKRIKGAKRKHAKDVAAAIRTVGPERLKKGPVLLHESRLASPTSGTFDAFGMAMEEAGVGGPGTFTFGVQLVDRYGVVVSDPGRLLIPRGADAADVLRLAKLNIFLPIYEEARSLRKAGSYAEADALLKAQRSGEGVKVRLYLYREIT